MGVEHCYRKGFIANYRPIANYEYHTVVSRGHTVGANVHCEEGNNPDRRLRSQSSDEVGNDVGRLRQPGCWLRSSHHSKKA